QRAGLARDQQQVQARLGELVGKRRTDALGAAGDDGPRAVDVLVDHGRSSPARGRGADDGGAGAWWWDRWVVHTGRGAAPKSGTTPRPRARGSISRPRRG